MEEDFTHQPVSSTRKRLLSVITYGGRLSVTCPVCRQEVIPQSPDSYIIKHCEHEICHMCGHAEHGSISDEHWIAFNHGTLTGCPKSDDDFFWRLYVTFPEDLSDMGLAPDSDFYERLIREKNKVRCCLQLSYLLRRLTPLQLKALACLMTENDRDIVRQYMYCSRHLFWFLERKQNES